MRQPKNVLSGGLLFLLLSMLAVTPVAPGAEPGKTANWEKVKHLAPGQEVQIVQSDAKWFQGVLRSVSDEDLVIRLAIGEQTFAKGSISRVSSKGSSHRLRNAALGAGVGFGAGAGIGAAVWSSDALVGRGAVAAGLGVFGMAVGAVVGAVLPTGRGWHEVYRAQ